MKTITLSGGFHNSGEIRFRISEAAYQDLKDGNSLITEVLTDNQLSRAHNHFCGIKGCCCGGVTRATIEF